MEIGDIIALIALIISILSLISSFCANGVQKRINEVNIQARYFEDIFREYFLHKIPDATRKLKFEANGRLSPDYKELNKVFMSMLSDCAYFAYAKHDFYDTLRDKLSSLDEDLVGLSGKIIIDQDTQKKTIYELHESVMDIVKYINKNYMKI